MNPFSLLLYFIIYQRLHLFGFLMKRVKVKRFCERGKFLKLECLIDIDIYDNFL